jgi:hypothetical protein
VSTTGVQYAKLGPLRQALAEAARTDESNAERAVERFVELRPGHEDTLKARQHHLLSGRRGTGKSTLLHVALAHLRESGAPVAVIDMEKFKNRPFPDVLIEILINLLDELRPRLRPKSLLPDLRLRRQFNASRRELEQMLRDPQSWSKQLSRSRDRSRSSGGTAMVVGRAKHAGVGVEAAAEAARTTAVNDSVTESAAYEELKIERLQQLASRISDELGTLVRNSEGDRAAVFIDDFYFVRLGDQPDVLDYMKTVAKGTGIWLKASVSACGHSETVTRRLACNSTRTSTPSQST